MGLSHDSVGNCLSLFPLLLPSPSHGPRGRPESCDGNIPGMLEDFFSLHATRACGEERAPGGMWCLPACWVPPQTHRPQKAQECPEALPQSSQRHCRLAQHHSCPGSPLLGGLGGGLRVFSSVELMRRCVCFRGKRGHPQGEGAGETPLICWDC